MEIVHYDTVAVEDARPEGDDRQPFWLTLRDHPAWPGNSLILYFDWNAALERWVWRVEFEVRDEDIGSPADDTDATDHAISPQPVVYGQNYQCGEYFSFLFVDLAQSAEFVTASNLGDEVDLVGIPGPESPGWEEWVREQRFESVEERNEWLRMSAVSEQEEERILG